MPFRLRTLVFGVAAVLVLGDAIPSRAAVVTYTSSAAFEAALSSSNLWTFTGPTGNPVVVLNSLGTDIVNVTTLGGDAAGIINDNALCGRTSNAVDCFKPVVFTFLESRNAFGYDNLDFNGFEEAVVQVTFAGGAPPFSTVFDLGGQPAFTPIFFGLTSDAALASVTIYSRDPGSTTVGERANVIDNVRVGIAVPSAPEPGVLALLGSGLAGVLLRRVRRA